MVGAVILSRVIADAPLAESLIAAVAAGIAGPSPETKPAEEVMQRGSRTALAPLAEKSHL
jgi:hypothetical protein